MLSYFKNGLGIPVKLLLSFLFISLVPLAIALSLNIRATSSLLENNAHTALSAAASHTALRLKGFIESNLDVIYAESQLPVLADYLNSSSTNPQISPLKIRLARTMNSLVRKNQVFLSSYALVDISGNNVFDTEELNIGTNLSNRSYYQQALETGLPFASDVEFDQAKGDAYLYFSSPVNDEQGRFVGVLRARYSAAILQQLIVEDSGLVGSKSFAMLTNSNNLILAYGIFSHAAAETMIFRPITDVPLEKIAELKHKRLLPPDIEYKVKPNIPTLQTGLLMSSNLNPYFTSVLPSTGDDVFAAATTHMKTSPWLVTFFQPQDVFLSPTRNQVRKTLYLAVVIAAFVSGAALVWANYLSKPIRELTKVAKRITQGDLSAGYKVQTKDEIGLLGDTFNFMTFRLRQRIEKEALMSEISRKFIYLDAADTVMAIYDALRAIGIFAGVERSFLFQRNALDTNIFAMTNQWTKKNLVPLTELLQKFNTEEYPDVISMLARGKHINQDDINSDFLTDREERSFLCVALLRNDGVSGFVGFETSGASKDWLLKDKELLRTTGEIISSTLERQRAEQDKIQAEEQLRHSMKMEAVGTLAGGLAHDFNNLLQGISGYIQLLLMKKTEDDHDREYLEKASQASIRAADLVRRLLIFSRKVDVELSPINVNDVILNAVHLLERTIPKMVAIRTLISPELFTIQADSTQIEQVVVNLTNNAVDAMENSGKLVIKAKNLTVKNTSSYNSIKLHHGEYVMIQISDNGQGMDQPTLTRIFEPFFTTKDLGKGTGLGLATVYGIVKDHHGYIDCTSTPGKGTTFTIVLPAGNLSPKKEKVEAIPDINKKGKESILLVDDEDDILETTANYLTEYGYTTHKVSSAEEAIRFCRKHGESIDVIVMDIGMPGMGGVRGLEELKKSNKDIKVIIASGYSDHKIAKDPIGYGAFEFVSKPYNLDKLVVAIRDVLDTDKS